MGAAAFALGGIQILLDDYHLWMGCSARGRLLRRFFQSSENVLSVISPCRGEYCRVSASGFMTLVGPYEFSTTEIDNPHQSSNRSTQKKRLGLVRRPLHRRADDFDAEFLRSSR